MSNSNAEKLQIKNSDHLSIALSSSSTSCRQTLIALTSLSLWSRQHERGSCAHAQVCVLTPFPASGCCCLPIPREQPPVREPWPFTAGYQPPEPLTLALVTFGQGPNAKGILDVFPTASSRSFPFPEGAAVFHQEEQPVLGALVRTRAETPRLSKGSCGSSGKPFLRLT